MTSNRKLPQDYHNLAHSKGFKWVGSEITTTTWPTWWECPKGHKWYNSYDSVSRNVGCLICRLSTGARIVAEALADLGIDFVTGQTIPGCQDKGVLMFDFCFRTNDKTCLIEYDGVQHFERVGFWHTGEQFEAAQRRDRIKDKFAQDNNFILIRVRYDTKNIRDYLLEQLQSHCLI